MDKLGARKRVAAWLFQGSRGRQAVQRAACGGFLWLHDRRLGPFLHPEQDAQEADALDDQFDDCDRQGERTKEDDEQLDRDGRFPRVDGLVRPVGLVQREGTTVVSPLVGRVELDRGVPGDDRLARATSQVECQRPAVRWPGVVAVETSGSREAGRRVLEPLRCEIESRLLVQLLRAS